MFKPTEAERKRVKSGLNLKSATDKEDQLVNGTSGDIKGRLADILMQCEAISRIDVARINDWTGTIQVNKDGCRRRRLKVNQPVFLS